jgi:mono/diheme cytochrome c family protein
MKKWLGIFSGFAIGAALLAAGSGTPAAAAPGKNAPPAAGSSAVERGKYLVEILACGDCHTPKKMGPQGPEDDASRLLAGHVGSAPPPAPAPSGPWIAHTIGEQTAWAGPWGVSFTKNLTPDELTGIGSWSEETFVKALRTGKHMGVSRPILPPMPWQSYAKMTDADLKAVYAYLRTIPPVRNPQPDPIAPPGERP